MAKLATIALVIADYDEAIDWFTNKLGFSLVADSDLGSGKRWVVVAPAGGAGANLLLAKAEGKAQAERVGDQTGGRVFLFLETENFDRDYESMRTRGVHFIEAPRHEAYGSVAVFEDLYGNRWDLIAPKTERS